MAVYQVNVTNILCVDTDEPFHVDDSDAKNNRSSPSGGDGDLIAYRTSDKAVQYFCSICSAQLLVHYLGKLKELGGEREGEYWCVSVGALERTEGIVQPGHHIWVEDTLDGGLADHLRSVGDTELPRYRRRPHTEELPIGWKGRKESPKPTDNDAEPDALHFSCHCETVQFKITRPNEQSRLTHAAFPDLLHPYDITHLAKLRNSSDVKWWLRPLGAENPTKYFAGHCACTYCRLTSGFEIQSWVYVPRSNIIVESTGLPLELKEKPVDELEEVKEAAEKLGISVPSTEDNTPTQERSESRSGTEVRMKGLTQYISSPGRYREFCQNCGATAFAWQAGRPDLICVAVGLVDETQAGARAEDWLDWCLTRVGFSEQAVSPATVEGVLKSLNAVQLENEHKAQTIVTVKQSGGGVDPRKKDNTTAVVTLVEEVVVAA